MMDSILHAGNPLNSEFTLCGDAFDIEAVDKNTNAPVFATKGQVINCSECRKVIDYCANLRGGDRYMRTYREK